MLRQLVSPEKRPITFVRRVTSSKRTLQQIRGPEPLAQPRKAVQMDAQRQQVLGQVGRCDRIWPLQFGDQCAQPPFGIGRISGFIQSRTVRSLYLVVQTGALRKLGDHIAQLMYLMPRRHKYAVVMDMMVVF